MPKPKAGDDQCAAKTRKTAESKSNNAGVGKHYVVLVVAHADVFAPFNIRTVCGDNITFRAPSFDSDPAAACHPRETRYTTSKADKL